MSDTTPEQPTTTSGDEFAAAANEVEDPGATIPNVGSDAKSGFGGDLSGGTYDPANAQTGGIVNADDDHEQGAQPRSDRQGSQGSEVPDGNRDEVLSWVGDDQARAQAALDAENAKDSPRSTLVSSLEPIAQSSDR